MPDSTWFLTLRIAIHSLMPFLQKKASLNSTCIGDSDGRGMGQFYNISRISLTQHRSSKFGNKAVRCVFASMWILFHFVEHQWHFPTLFTQLFFCLGISQ